MRLQLDQGTPRSTVRHLDALGIEAVHVADIGLSTATDSRILDYARADHRVVATLDADFHALLALPDRQCCASVEKVCGVMPWPCCCRESLHG